MTTLACTLVLLCVSLVGAHPVAKKLPLGGDDVLAGSDFLSVFMRRSGQARPESPFEPHHLNSVELVRPFPQLADKYELVDIFKSAKYGYATNEMPTEVEDYQNTTPNIVNPTIESEVKTTTTQFMDPTTIEDVPTTVVYSTDEKSNNDNPQSTSTVDEESLKIEPTTRVVTDKVEQKVISVRVSSSVVRHSHRPVEVSTIKAFSDVKQKIEADNLVSTLITQEQPTITAVQRSELGVEEASHSQSETTDSHDQAQEEVEGKVQEVSLYNHKQRSRPGDKLPVFEIHFQNPPEGLIFSNKAQQKPNVASVASYIRKEEQNSPFGVPVKSSGYSSRIPSSTVDSSVQFFRDQPRGRNTETVVTGAVLHPATTTQDAIQGHTPDDSQTSTYHRESRDQVYKEQRTSTYPEEPREQIYGESERVYGQPEANYEVDEAVSVITNGKAHGIQTPTSPPQTEQNKFGYVVEGQNFRKYRVEERTSDGFIVGEYGVVSHDDGSLRGVRYTADSTINPRLIYDTLVKFLSLQ